MAIALTPPWLSKSSVEAAAQSFTIAVLPDTQKYAELAPDIFTAQTQWLADNKVANNIVFVLHEGDITENNNDTEWARTDTSMSILDGVVPYALATGSHDMGAEGPPDADSRDTTLFNTYFPVSRYQGLPTFGGVYKAGKLDNSYHFFSAGGVDWLVLALEFGPRDPVLDWANQVVSNYPDRKTILVTHTYLYSDNTLHGSGIEGGQVWWNPHNYGIKNEPGGVNDGVEMWDKLVRLHSNIVMVLNGHVLNDGTGQLVSIGDGGNNVYQMLANYQTLSNGGNGYLRLLEFDPAQETVSVKTYSPYLDAYLTDAENQFEFLNVDFFPSSGGGVADITPPSVPTGLAATAASQTQIDLSWTAASDAESGVASYNIYRGGIKVGSTGGLSFSDTGLTEGTGYTYEVSAVNGAGLEGPKSNPVTQSTLADTTAPTIASVSASGDGVGVMVVFSEAVDQTTATSAANYSIDNSISIASASLGADLKTVTLGTSSHTEGVTYTLTVSNVLDRATVPNAIAPNTQVSYSFVAQVVITGLTVASGKAYEVVDNGLDTGALVYIDRAYTFSSVPPAMAGATYIKTANDDKGRTEEAFMSFTVNRGVTVYVAYDVRATSLPGWLSGWADTGTTLGTTDLDRQLYAKSFAAGIVSLGGNMAAGASGAESSYSIVIGGSGPIFPTLPGMSAPAQDLDGDGLAEDTNGNGRLDFADVVALFNHLDSSAVQDNETVFDFDGNGSVDSSDVVALFDMLVP